MRLSTTKITSIVECAAQRAKFHKRLLGTPQAPKPAEQTKKNRLMPIEKKELRSCEISARLAEYTTVMERLTVTPKTFRKIVDIEKEAAKK